MGHNANQALMGATKTSAKEVSNFPTVSGSTVEAGLACILESSGKISLDTSEGQLVGISLGKDLSDTGVTAVCRKGIGVLVKLKSGFTPTIGAAVAIENDTGLARAYTGSGDRYVNAVYSSSKLSASAIGEDGVNKDAAYIDFPGGL